MASCSPPPSKSDLDAVGRDNLAIGRGRLENSPSSIAEAPGHKDLCGLQPGCQSDAQRRMPANVRTVTSHGLPQAVG